MVDDIGKLYDTYFTHEPQAAVADAQISSFKKRLLKRLLSAVLVWRRRALLSDGRYLAHRKPGRLLDVGCGNGNFLAGMAERGWEAVGVEFDESAVLAARSHHNIEIRHGSVGAQRFPDKFFDAITLSNVIEHLHDPGPTFDELKRILAPGARLVLITPNINSMGHRIFGRCWRGLEPPRHLFLFNRKTLSQFAERSGLKVDACFTVPGGSNILKSSAELWARKPRQERRPLTTWIYVREVIKTSFGSGDGEFVVLLATY